MFDPDAPAFGPNAQSVEELKAPAVEKAEPEVKTDVQTPVEKVEETSDEGTPVPYSRFKKFHDQAKEAQAEAERLRGEAEEWKRKASAIEPKAEQTDLPDYWKELYGDSDASRKAWDVQSKANQSVIEQATREAREALKAETRAEQERVEKNLKSIDSNLEALNDFAGRELTEAEQSAVLDIVDKFSPQDQDGNYISALPFEKAYEIYELQQQAGKAPKVQSRNKVASITNTKTQGTPSDDQAERNKNFNPLDWGAAARRIKE